MNKFKQKLKNFTLVILSCIIILLFIIKSSHFNNKIYQFKLNKEKNKLSDKILKTRKLEENQEENTHIKNYDKFCEKGSKDLNEFYSAENIGDIEKIDNYIKYDNKDKDKPYFKSLINIINYLIYNKTEREEKKSLLKIDSIKNDVNTYIKHMVPVIIFFVFGILIFIGWIASNVWCCCDCCCCCKEMRCKFPLVIIACILYIFSISICIYGQNKSDSIIIGIADTKCFILKYFDQILEGEEKQTFPKWPGFNKISDILIDIKDQIKDLRNITLNDLNQELNNIENKKIIFKNKMKESGNAFFSPPNSNTYINLYCSDEYNINSRGITGKYVLDLVKIFGRKADIDEEKYEPKNSILDTWHNEYKLISKNADIYLEKTLNDLTIISDNNDEDIVESLEQEIKNINILKDFFNDINIDIEDILINNIDLIDKSGKKLFKIFFLITGLINFIIPIWMVVICLFKGKIGIDYCSIRFTFKYLIHILWNILYFFIIITFILGILLIFVGTLGNEIVSVVSFIISEENLGEEGEKLIVDQLGAAKNYLNMCINGDGRIHDLININNNQNNSLNNLIKNEEQINEIKNEFKEKKNFSTYSYYIDQLKGRSNLSIIPILIKDTYDINLPINIDQYYGNQPDKYLKFDIELEEMNKLIKSQKSGTNKNEQWKINSNSPNECGSGDDPIYYFSEFNPLKCKPMNRDWIQTTSSNDIKAEAKIITDILSFLENANNKNENLNNSEFQSFINILNNLKRVYNEYLDQYIITLKSFNNTLNKITGKLRQYINNDDNIFSFMNGKIIGTNLKIMLKYLKKTLGKDVKNFGICFLILGIFLAVSVYCTILFIIILNIELKNEIKSKVNIEGYDNTHIIDNPADIPEVNSITGRTIDRLPQKRSYANEYFKEAYNLLIKGCKIDPDILDKRGNCQSGWRTGSKNGPKGYLKDYHPPIGWTGIGLKVASMYDNGNNVWLGNDNCNGEWYIGYHGVKSIEAIHGICIDGFRRGDGQAYENSVNINPLTNKQFPKCEEGVYFTNEIKEAKKYTKLIKYNGNKYRIVFMCRVNPYKVRIAKVKGGGEYWIVKGDKLGDLRGIKRSDEVRPYRILMLKEKNN